VRRRGRSARAGARWLASALALALAATGCSAQPPSPVTEPAAPKAAPEQAAAPEAAPPAQAAAAAPEDDPSRAAQPEVRRMLETVARARGLPIRRDVPGRVLDRGAILARIRAHVEKEIPAEELVYQGEVLASLELIPADYDFAAGMYRLLEGRIAGFYEPADATMYLVDDLGENEAEETLAHELAHALQDQSFPLGPMLKHAPGDSDRLAAAHALIEGDATSAMLDVAAGSAFNIDEALLRKLVAVSTALSSVGDTPRALQESLAVPYTDGFSFVQHLRRKGGWPAVDEAWRALPESTEQLLHPEKFAKREKPVYVPAPPIDALGPGFSAVFNDVMGEQGTRIAFEDYAHRDLAVAAAAGWGGDRLVVARRERPEAPGHVEYALAWRLRFDMPADAREAARVLEARFGRACRARPALGPVAWAIRDSDVAMVAGPYERAGASAAGAGARAAKATGTCAKTKAWLDAVIKAPLGGAPGQNGGGAPGNPGGAAPR